LKGVKLNDIPQMTKLGRIEIIHGLVEHHKLGSDVVDFRGLQDEIISTSGERYQTDAWNPLLVAIANKRTDLVRYFIEDAKVSLRLHGGRPLAHNEISSPESEAFSLWLAIHNKDVETLQELLSHYRAWDIEHITHSLKSVAGEKWTPGVSIVLTSNAAKTIFESLPY
jgi:hypothetical protein